MIPAERRSCFATGILYYRNGRDDDDDILRSAEKAVSKTKQRRDEKDMRKSSSTDGPSWMERPLERRMTTTTTRGGNDAIGNNLSLWEVTELWSGRAIMVLSMILLWGEIATGSSFHDQILGTVRMVLSLSMILL